MIEETIENPGNTDNPGSPSDPGDTVVIPGDSTETPKEEEKVDTNNTLPQTGSPISSLAVTIMSGLMIVGGVLLNKKKVN